MVSARVSRRLSTVAYICQAVLDVPFPSVGGVPVVVGRLALLLDARRLGRRQGEDQRHGGLAARRASRASHIRLV